MRHGELSDFAAWGTPLRNEEGSARSYSRRTQSTQKAGSGRAAVKFGRRRLCSQSPGRCNQFLNEILFLRYLSLKSGAAVATYVRIVDVVTPFARSIGRSFKNLMDFHSPRLIVQYCLLATPPFTSYRDSSALLEVCFTAQGRRERTISLLS